MSDFQSVQHRKHVEANGIFQARAFELFIPPERFWKPQAALVGILEVEMCNECGIIVTAACSHRIYNGTIEGINAMTWFGNELHCVICRCDGT